MRAWWDIGRHPVFLAWGLLVGCTYGGLFTILAASSFVYMDVLGLSPTACGGVMALGSLSYLGSTFVCRRWIKQLGMAGAVRRGALFTLAGGLLAAALAAAGVHTVWAVLLPQCPVSYTHLDVYKRQTLTIMQSPGWATLCGTLTIAA